MTRIFNKHSEKEKRQYLRNQSEIHELGNLPQLRKRSDRNSSESNCIADSTISRRQTEHLT